MKLKNIKIKKYVSAKMSEYFLKDKSKIWDINSKRVKNTRSMSNLIVKNINIRHTMTVRKKEAN